MLGLWPQDGLKRVTDAASLARRPRLLLASALLVTHHYGQIFSQEHNLNVHINISLTVLGIQCMFAYQLSRGRQCDRSVCC